MVKVQIILPRCQDISERRVDFLLEKRKGPCIVLNRKIRNLNLSQIAIDQVDTRPSLARKILRESAVCYNECILSLVITICFISFWCLHI